jgi:hypothetical protein
MRVSRLSVSRMGYTEKLGQLKSSAEHVANLGAMKNRSFISRHDTA